MTFTFEIEQDPGKAETLVDANAPDPHSADDPEGTPGTGSGRVRTDTK